MCIFQVLENTLPDISPVLFMDIFFKVLTHFPPNRWKLVINNEKKNRMLGKWHAVFPSSWYKPLLIIYVHSFSSGKGSFLKGICNMDKAESDFLSLWSALRHWPLRLLLLNRGISPAKTQCREVMPSPTFLTLFHKAEPSLAAGLFLIFK